MHISQLLLPFDPLFWLDSLFALVMLDGVFEFLESDRLLFTGGSSLFFFFIVLIVIREVGILR